MIAHCKYCGAAMVPKIVECGSLAADGEGAGIWRVLSCPRNHQRSVRHSSTEDLLGEIEAAIAVLKAAAKKAKGWKQ